ncbi:MAG TPA: hypothetical protein VFM98_13820, partial [Ramlibacter sp.]|nr:hypothetical protein [Ramlibacter sp.]
MSEVRNRWRLRAGAAALCCAALGAAQATPAPIQITDEGAQGLVLSNLDGPLEPEPAPRAAAAPAPAPRPQAASALVKRREAWS